MKPINRTAVIEDSDRHRRLDQAAADLFPEFSRARLQHWIKEGLLTLNGHPVKPNSRVKSGDRLNLSATPEREVTAEPEAIPLDLLAEDEHVVVINKPAGLVVHPAAGNWSGTLQNALLHHFPELENVPRAGIVHRLDKMTSGVMVVARTLQAHKHLVDQLQRREMHREYVALALGEILSGGTINLPIGRHPKDRKRMAVVAGGKPAVTHYRVLQRLTGVTLLKVNLETGRTHQIRVHLSHQGHALVGDPVYGGRNRPPRGMNKAGAQAVRDFARQALHARRLRFDHPDTGQSMEINAPMPDDLEALLNVVQSHDDV